MADYYFLVNPGRDIYSEVNICRFVSNRLKKSIQEPEFKLFVYTQKAEENRWQVVDEVYFNGESNIQLRSTDYDLDVGSIAVIVTAELNDVSAEYSHTLMDPFSRKIDFSIVADRSAISFHRGAGFSSYQGEFPHQMSKIKGTFLGFDPLVQRNCGSVDSVLVFVNIFSQSLQVKENFTFVVASADTRKIISTHSYTHNSAAIIPVASLDDGAKVFYSKDTLGVPIFLSYENGFDGNVTVEHTHPPAELFMGKLEGQRAIKANWLSVLP